MESRGKSQGSSAQHYPPSIFNPPLAVFLWASSRKALFVLTGTEIHFQYLSYAGWIHLNSLSAVFLPHGFVGVSICDIKPKCHSTCAIHLTDKPSHLLKVHGLHEDIQVFFHPFSVIIQTWGCSLSRGTQPQMRTCYENKLTEMSRLQTAVNGNAGETHTHISDIPG